MMQINESIETNTNLTEKLEQFSEELKYQIGKMHD